MSITGYERDFYRDIKNIFLELKEIKIILLRKEVRELKEIKNMLIEDLTDENGNPKEVEK